MEIDKEIIKVLWNSIVIYKDRCLNNEGMKNFILNDKEYLGEEDHNYFIMLYLIQALTREDKGVKIIHNKFITLLDKETINNISLLNHHLCGTLIDENYSFDFSKIANEVRDKLDNITDINNRCFYDEYMEYWYTDKNGDLISDEYSLDIEDEDKYNDILEIGSHDILKSILGNELYSTIY